MATPLWKCEIRFDGPNWVDVSGYALLPKGVNIQRGRDSETGDAIPVGTCSFTLENNDGRFTAERSASPYYPYVVEGVACRVSVYVSGAYRVRFYGAVQSWATSWVNDDTGLHAVTAVTVTDTLGDLPDYTFRSAANEVIRGTSGVLYHWPLFEQPVGALIGDVAGTDNGGSGWGEGSTLALDESANHPKFTSGSGGLTITMQPLVVTPTYPWRLRFVLFGPPTANCNLLRYLSPSMTTPAQYITWNTSTGIAGPGSGIMPSSWPVVVELGLVNTGSMPLRVCEADGTVTTSNFAPGFNFQAPTKLWINPSLSGGSVWSIGHLVLMSGAPDTTQLQTYTAALLASRLPVDAPSTVSGYGGGPTITGAPASGMILPPLDGRDWADVMGALVTGMGARLVDDLDGTLTWLPFPPSDAPVALPSGEIDPSMTWQTDSTGSWTDATVTFTDGTSYTARRSARKKRSFSFEGVHTTPLGDRGMADWLVNSPTPARFPQAPYDLMTLSDAQRLTLCSVTVGTRVSLSGLPAQMPASTALAICEGIEESASDTEWALTLKLSPDVYSRLFVLDDATQGVLDSTYILAP